MLPIEYQDEATQDFNDSMKWYASQSARAATRFSAAIDEAVESIAANPERFALLDEINRRHFVKDFPFYLVYRILLDRILIVAVAHGRREFGYWKYRK